MILSKELKKHLNYIYIYAFPVLLNNIFVSIFRCKYSMTRIPASAWHW